MDAQTVSPEAEAKPSMTAWEREGFVQDLIFAGEWIRSEDPAMRIRGEAMVNWVAEQVALYA